MNWVEKYIISRRHNLAITQSWSPDARQLLIANHCSKLVEYIQATPYRFDGARHKITHWRECRERGYAACADAASLIAAALEASGVDARRVKLCYETTPGALSYAHVRVLLDGGPIEPYPAARVPVSACTWTMQA